VADRKEVRLAGAGNHGMIEAGLILQEAAAIYDDKNAHHVQSYGPEARSNAARSEVIISDGDIDYPKATQLDVFLATTQEAVERYAGDLKPDGVLILDDEVEYSGHLPQKTFRVPLLETCEKKLGKPGLVHVVALGVLVEFSDVVTKPAIEAAVQDHVPRGGEELYMEALKTGYELGKKARQS
jgi:2-oxoglutarate ferredoxin oxidoreductase subunit gamma